METEIWESFAHNFQISDENRADIRGVNGANTEDSLKLNSV